MMILLIFLLFLPFSSADLFSRHLSENVNVSVRPCDDFFHHVCSQSASATFPQIANTKFYQRFLNKSRKFVVSLNLPIMHDIGKYSYLVTKNVKDLPTFNRTEYTMLIRSRCEEDDACYQSEFDYFYNVYKTYTEKNVRLTYFNDQIEHRSSDEIVEVLTNMLTEFYEAPAFVKLSRSILQNSSVFYAAMMNRLYVLEDLMKMGVLKRVVNVEKDVELFKEIIISKLKNTPWLNEKDGLALSWLPFFEEKIKRLVVTHDLDYHDRNLELLREINGEYTAKSTGIDVLDHFFLLATMQEWLDEGFENEEKNLLFERITANFNYGAHYADYTNRVYIYGPLVYPEITNNDTLDKHYMLYQTIAHEIFHSIIKESVADFSEPFESGMECYNNHFNRSCELFPENFCNSGPQTFEEDGPDLEGMRVSYKFFKMNNKEEDLETVVYHSDTLNVTREQAFFYVYAMFHCNFLHDLDEIHTDEHSLSKVRVNGILTQMPEFTRAFSCSSDQQMFADEDNICHLFGPESKCNMILLILLHLLPFSSADILSDHLTSNVNVSVDPCDDFFLHVCSQSVNASQYPFSKISDLYTDIVVKFRNISRSRNLAIMNDITKLNETTSETKPVFNQTVFIKLLEERCKENDDCYREEFKYFAAYYVNHTKKSTKRLQFFLSKLYQLDREEILKTLPLVVESIYNLIPFDYSSLSRLEFRARYFYGSLTNRLFAMESLKEAGIFEKIVNIQADLKQFKEIIIEKFKNTPWLNEKDELGLSMLAEFEDKIHDLIVYYDLDENDRDLELLRKINGKFTKDYYQAKLRSTGIEVFDIFLSLYTAYNAVYDTPNTEEVILAIRVESRLAENALYFTNYNRVAILAPYLYPELTDYSTLNKHYNLFGIIGHEIFHSVVKKDWANQSVAFRNRMECMNDHFNRTCDLFGEGSCNSGAQTFEEDGPDLEGLRINYEFMTRNYKEAELKEIVYKSESLSVERQQAFFYLYGISFCDRIRSYVNHTDVHSHSQVRTNGVVTQMPEFAQAFECTPDQPMFAEKGKTCNLFGPDFK